MPQALTAQTTGELSTLPGTSPAEAPKAVVEPESRTVPEAGSAPATAYAWMALSATLFALMNFFARLASAKVPWTMVGATRALVGVLVALAVGRLGGSALRVRDQRGMWLRSLLGTASMLCTFYALSRPALPLGDTTTLLNLTPVFVALLTPFFLREPTGARVVASLSISLAGVLLVLRPAALFGGQVAAEGAVDVGLVAALAAVFAAFAMMMLRRLGPRESPAAISMHFSLVAAGTFALLSAPSLILPSEKDALHMILAGLCAGFAQIAMTRAYALERAARVSAVGYLAVAVSGALGAAVLEEWPRGTTLLGMALVVGGGLVIALGARPSASGLPSRR